MTEWEKYKAIRKEALFTGLALLVLIVFWCFAGFGLREAELKIFHLPLWVLASSIGVWLMAILLVKFLTGCIFKDMDLSEGGKDHD